MTVIKLDKKWKPKGPWLVARRRPGDSAIVARRISQEDAEENEGYEAGQVVWCKYLTDATRFETKQEAQEAADEIGGWVIPELLGRALDISA